MWKILNYNKENNYQMNYCENNYKIFTEKNSEYYKFLNFTEDQNEIFNYDGDFNDLKFHTISKLKEGVNYYVESTKLLKKDKEKDKYMLINKKNRSIDLRFLNKKKRNIRFLESEF